VCHETVEDEVLADNPLAQYCLCTLNAAQQRVLENDLGLASRVQWALLPPQNLCAAGWEAHYRYLPHGPVSGDACDLVVHTNGTASLHFLIGDVSGKGVAASLLMAHMHAMFRSLIATGLGIGEVVERANRLFADSAFRTTHYLTLVAGRADADGTVEICNAGHPPPVLLRNGSVETLGATGFPVGLMKGGTYDIRRLRLGTGETLVFYTDGLTEGESPAGEGYGLDRLSALLGRAKAATPQELAKSCLADAAAFRAGTALADDLTVLVIQRGAC
jgi:sigma-B regulation protein RsbU (phosphoserine phosphatase)